MNGSWTSRRTGAFTLSLCRRYRTLTATIIDFPSIRPMAERVAEEAGLADRVTFLPGNALTSAWPDRQDAVLMSYLLSAVAEHDGRSLITRALGALKPGGRAHPAHSWSRMTARVPLAALCCSRGAH